MGPDAKVRGCRSKLRGALRVLLAYHITAGLNIREGLLRVHIDHSAALGRFPKADLRRREGFPPSWAFRLEITRASERHKADERIREEQQGHGRPIVAFQAHGQQLVAVGNKLHFSPKWKTFPDFLVDYVKCILDSAAAPDACPCGSSLQAEGAPPCSTARRTASGKPLWPSTARSQTSANLPFSTR
jgi:hypothetical protein